MSRKLMYDWLVYLDIAPLNIRRNEALSKVVDKHETYNELDVTPEAVSHRYASKTKEAAPGRCWTPKPTAGGDYVYKSYTFI